MTRNSPIDWAFLEITFDLDGYLERADHVALGRAVAAWRARNPELAAPIDAVTVVDALAGHHH